MTGLASNLQLGKVLGAGHFGRVHEGVDDIHGKVAVKIPQKWLNESQADWEARRDALLEEGQNLKRAQHPNVVTVLHLVRDQISNDLLLSMEFCSGGSLQSPYEAGPLPNGRVVEIAADVAQGLCAIHDRNLLHRDIKPANILLDGEGHAKLGDFGLVTDQIILGYADRAGYTDHLAYEVWQTSQTSVRTDIWALGMTFYRLLHGHPFYQASPAPRRLVHKGRFAQTLRWLPHVSDKWRRLIRSMMNDDRSSRPTMQKIINALGDLRGEPNWICEQLTDGWRWERAAGDRNIIAEKRKRGGLFTWSVVSEPANGGGRKRTLKAGGPVTSEAADRSLHDYFSSAR